MSLFQWNAAVERHEAVDHAGWKTGANGDRYVWALAGHPQPGIFPTYPILLSPFTIFIPTKVLAADVSPLLKVKISGKVPIDEKVKLKSMKARKIGSAALYSSNNFS
jgi:hypothetical protein